MSTSLMERNLNQVETGRQTQNPSQRKTFVPRADILESQDKLILHVDLPGVSQDNLDITLENNVLAIVGKVEPNEHPGFTLSYSEYGTGDYCRSFTLSNAIDRDNIEASLKNGVLTLTLPKSKAMLPKKISVQSC